MKLSKEQLREAVSAIYDALAEGQTDRDIMELMGIGRQEYEAFKAAMFDDKADELRQKPHEHVYVEYMLSQSKNIRDLTDMINQMHSTKNFTAMVGAVRARADILDRLIEKGQQFGLVHKQAERKEIVAGVMVADLSDKQLKKMILKELGMLSDLRKQYGEKSMKEIDGIGELHSGPALLLEKEETEQRTAREIVSERDKEGHKRRSKSKTMKVRGGRRTVRKPGPQGD